MLSRGFLDDVQDVALDLFTIILLLINSLHPFCDSLVHSRCKGLFCTVIEFGIGIGILRLHFSFISLIHILSPITEFILLWIREFLVVGQLVVTQMQTSLSSAWLCTKGIDLGVVTINTRDLRGPTLIIIALFLLHWIII